MTVTDACLWRGAFWHRLVYPELAMDATDNPEHTVTWALAHDLGDTPPEAVFCVGVDDIDMLDVEAQRPVIARMDGLLRETLPAHQQLVLGIAHRYFFYACARDESRNLPTLLPRLESIRAAANAEFSLRITIGVAVLPDASSDAMRWAAQRAVVALRQGQGLGGNRVLRFDERTMPTAYSLSGYWQTLGRLKALVYAGESTGAWAAADSAAYLIFHAHYLPLHHLRPLLASQVILLAQAMLEAGVDAETVAVLAERRLAELTADFDYVALARRLRATVDEALALVQAHRSAARRDLRQEAEAYVRTNLSDPALGLAVLADALAMSPSHLSRGCTQALGMTLTDFIHRERVSLAKGLLAGTSLSPSEVATRTGFGSYSSFAAVFRRSEGCSPTTYRAKSAQRAAK